MQSLFKTSLIVVMFTLSGHLAWADDYTEAIKSFQNAGESGAYFDNSYGYAVFPTIGKAGIGIGGAHGKGKVYKQGVAIGDSKMTQLTVGLQLGGQAYSQVIFFRE
jgi:lipid-binding SYLF domain-containing protein